MIETPENLKTKDDSSRADNVSLNEWENLQGQEILEEIDPSLKWSRREDKLFNEYLKKGLDRTEAINKAIEEVEKERLQAEAEEKESSIRTKKIEVIKKHQKPAIEERAKVA